MNWRLVVSILSCLLLSLGMLAGCDDDTAPIGDTAVEAGADGPAGDTVPWPDQATPDQFVWPDQGQDQIVWPDTYAGTPFGCKSDNDCFGKKCCPTPWGVQLCAPTCN